MSSKITKSQMHDLLNQYDIPVEDDQDINTINYYSAVFIIKNSELTENLFGIKFGVTSDPKSNYALATQMHRKIKKISEEFEEEEEEDEEEEEEQEDESSELEEELELELESEDEEEAKNLLDQLNTINKSIEEQLK